MGITISADQLASEIGKVLQTFANDCQTAVDDAAEEVAKEAVEELKRTSPVGSGTWKGHYAKKWSVKKDGGKYVIHNKKYQLTHLLEKGHDVIVNGKVVGRVKAQPHIKPVEEQVQDDFEKEIKKKIEGGL